MRKEFIYIVIFVFILIILRMFFFEIYTISQNSMNNTYKTGNKVLIIKNFYSVDYNDILVFEHENKKMIKRCIGLPGNTFKIIKGKTYSNNVLISLPSKALNKNISEFDAFSRSEIYNTYRKNDWTLYNFGSFLIPKKGMTKALSPKNIFLYKKLIESEDIDNLNLSKKERNYTFQNDFYFLMGDNRKESVDSRFFGPIKKSDIIGKVILKIW